MDSLVLTLDQVDRAAIARVGGKGAHLAELSRVEGVRVPAAFCVTTRAFAEAMRSAPMLGSRLERLSRLRPDDREAIREQSAEVRRAIESVEVAEELVEAITRAVAALGADVAFVVRSSATAEDLPSASFAGQQDTYLNAMGARAIVEHVRRCWASLFTERAVTYRARNRIDHAKVRMAVVVQKMIAPRASGVLFTADPVSGNRKVASVEATYGLGEALVSGLVNADVFRVRDGEVIAKTLGTKQLAVRASPAGGTTHEPVDPAQQARAALTDAQVVRLVELGRRIEAHFGAPQDVEWCLAEGDEFHFVQSRPITTLFPIPAAADGENHVYISVGHQQMMTDAMKPLGLSLWQMTTPRPMAEAGSRLFVDVTRTVAAPASRAGLLQLAGKSDPLLRDALESVVARGDFIRPVAEEAAPPAAGAAVPASAPPLAPDPAIVDELIAQARASIAKAEREIATRSGVAVFDFIVADLQELRRLLFDPRSYQTFMSAIEATWWLNDQLLAWLGEKNAADAFAQSVANNVTSEMGLALLDVADAIRPHAEVIAFLQRVADAGADDAFLEALTRLAGGVEARAAIRGWLDRYGMRCVGEIDITRPRFSERPSALVPMILGNIKSYAPGEAARRFQRGLDHAREKERELLERLRASPDGEHKVGEAKRRIDLLRTFIGYREFPKYAMVSRYFIYKRAMLQEAARLVDAGALREKEDAFFLRFDELHELARTHRVDEGLIRARKEAFAAHRVLTPPRVLTSDGEMLSGRFRREDVPPGALVGLAVSAGVVEGRARVVLDMADAAFEPGDILVTAYTDPSWTPAFVAVKGLVTEVGGLMTHGAVIAREYGLPAVVGVANATRLIPDGARIRLHGTEGYIELLKD